MSVPVFPDSSSALPKIIQARRQFIAKNLDISGRNVVEIGALDTPTILATDDAIVRYIDWFSREEMTVRHAKNSKRNIDNLVPVDYVVKTKRWRQ